MRPTKFEPQNLGSLIFFAEIRGRLRSPSGYMILIRRLRDVQNVGFFAVLGGIFRFTPDELPIAVGFSFQTPDRVLPNENVGRVPG